LGLTGALFAGGVNRRGRSMRSGRLHSVSSAVCWSHRIAAAIAPRMSITRPPRPIVRRPHAMSGSFTPLRPCMCKNPATSGRGMWRRLVANQEATTSTVRNAAGSREVGIPSARHAIRPVRSGLPDGGSTRRSRSGWTDGSPVRFSPDAVFHWGIALFHGRISAMSNSSDRPSSISAGQGRAGSHFLVVMRGWIASMARFPEKETGRWQRSTSAA